VRSEREIVGRLGSAGLARALSDLLDASRLIRLANSVGLSYPGMRTRSQKRGRLIADLTDRASRDDAAGKAVVRALLKETAGAAKEWGTLDIEARAGRLREAAVAGSNGRLGADLVSAAAGSPELAVDDALAALVASLAGPSIAPNPKAEDLPDETPERENQRLHKKAAELQKKIRYLEGQVAKTRDVEKGYKRDLMQRKGELAEARMLSERLRKELEDLRGASGGAETGGKPAAVIAGVDELDRSVKRLATEQRRLAHRLEKMVEGPPPVAQVPDGIFAPLQASISELERDVAALRRERRKDLQDQARRLDEI